MRFLSARTATPHIHTCSSTLVSKESELSTRLYFELREGNMVFQNSLQAHKLQQCKVLTLLYNIQIQPSSLGPCPSCNRYIKSKHHVSEGGSASVFRQEAPNLLDPLDQAILSHWVPLQHSQV